MGGYGVGGGSPFTRSQLASDLRALGVERGDMLEIHASLRAVGRVVGGVDAVVLALLDAVSAEGTLAVVASMEDEAIDPSAPLEAQRARRAEVPPFDPARSAVRLEHGVLAERVRTWPGALRGDHPEAGVAAVGARAVWLVAPHPANFAFGAGTPYERLKDAGGKALLLGAPLNTITMLHHAESIAPLPGKITLAYEMPILVDGELVWREYRDIDSVNGAFDYARIVPEGVDAFDVIAGAALEAGVGRMGMVGGARSHLFEAQALVEFAVAWLTERFA
ncbi:MAG: aminoglycoside 3-N-acetyltransferase [Dehalococcoidia bacterium]|nr:aminoglycoside 3-N-acetyltransferase [Dehalococcoidia bacterium]